MENTDLLKQQKEIVLKLIRQKLENYLNQFELAEYLLLHGADINFNFSDKNGQVNTILSGLKLIQK
ncbi:hypothetical protein BCR32DRAFT_280280 [Anaeromyces robustus]|uniref:Ankyrin n=1 Tax=Anaeromyces robustus TaxID=1754192 RepID=A0A1Y1X4N9_9FUNG|nr:hypothetical protein BCR32DRAFT_280280 [Anaeromyces robustus]|eukprot:ORX80779.1 hypothetical protein BCR32DRAFT_280280 [Anaeromyces robustus]